MVQAAPFMEEGERMLCAIVAQARGRTQAIAGSTNLGATQQGTAADAAAQAGLTVASPMGLAITNRRLLTFRIGMPWGLGLGGSVKELLSGVAIEDVDRIEVKRLLIGRVLNMSVRGHSFKLETGLGADVKGLAAALDQAKG